MSNTSSGNFERSFLASSGSSRGSLTAAEVVWMSGVWRAWTQPAMDGPAGCAHCFSGVHSLAQMLGNHSFKREVDPFLDPGLECLSWIRELDLRREFDADARFDLDLDLDLGLRLDLGLDRFVLCLSDILKGTA